MATVIMMIPIRTALMMMMMMMMMMMIPLRFEFWPALSSPGEAWPDQLTMVADFAGGNTRHQGTEGETMNSILLRGSGTIWSYGAMRGRQRCLRSNQTSRGRTPCTTTPTQRRTWAGRSMLSTASGSDPVLEIEPRGLELFSQ